MAPPRRTLPRERNSGPRQHALTSAKCLKERVKLSQSLEPQPSCLTLAEVKVEFEPSSSTSSTCSLAIKQSTSVADLNCVLPIAKEANSSQRRPAMTSAERVRLYRERVRLKQAQKPQPYATIKVENETSSSTSITNNSETRQFISEAGSSDVRQRAAEKREFESRQPALTPANRVSLLREHGKLIQTQEPQPYITVAEVKVEFEPSPSTSTSVSLTRKPCAVDSSNIRQQVAKEKDSSFRRPAMTSAERVRRHRERVRLRQAQELQPSTSDAGSSGVTQQVAKDGDFSRRRRGRPALTTAERMNLLSERIRLSQTQELQISMSTAGSSDLGPQVAIKNNSSRRRGRPALTTAERMSLLSERIRLTQAEELQPSTNAASSSGIRQHVATERDSGPQRPALTSAERVRLHRERVRLSQAQEQQSSYITMTEVKVEFEISSSPSIRSPDYRRRWKLATARFKTMFIDNEFGHKCDVCDRLWFKKDLKIAVSRFLDEAFPGENTAYFKLCRMCLDACKHGRMPAMSRTNGYRYPPYPTHLPKLGPIEERLVSPRLPYMQIRRLRNAGQCGIVGKVINIPVEVNNMVKILPRQLDDDYSINVNINRSLIHKSSYLNGSVDKENVKAWLEYLTNTPLYKHYNIRIDWERLEQQCSGTSKADVVIEPFDCAQEPESEIRNIRQHTVVWNESECLDIAPGQCASPLKIIYDRHAEELSFPTIYLGEARQIAEGTRDTPYTMSMSEIRRSDRRGVTPQHVLYMAMGIIHRRVTESIQTTLKFSSETKNINRRQIEDRDFAEQLLEVNTAFLKTIPNSVQYWAGCKRDLFAMIRQLGKPTAFMTLNANEAHWPHLLRILHKWNPEWHAEYGSDITENDIMEKMSPYKRQFLVTEDPIICCVYFYKLVTCLLNILSSERTYNPFGRYRVVDFFLRIEFQHCGSPQANILLWLANDPKEPLSENMPLTVNMLTDLCSVDKQDLPNEALLSNQTHEHTFACFKQGEEKCQFGIPFWPMPETRILVPLAEEDTRRELFECRVKNAREKLETQSYDSYDAYLSDIGTHSYDDYLQLIRSTLFRPTVLIKRDMNQIYINTFNPWIAATLKSNMDLQLILDSDSCAAYVVDFVNKSNRGISRFHRQLIDLHERNLQTDYTGLMKTLALRMLNSVEMFAQEAAWFLLRQPMSWASRAIVVIPTMLPHERHRDSNDVCSSNFIEKYQDRPQSLESITLAEFVAWYDMRPSTHGTRSSGDDEQVLGGDDKDHNTHVDADVDDENEAADQRANTGQSVDPARRRKICRVIRYRTYDYAKEMDQYKREHVLLYLPFRNEHADIIDCNKYLQIYDEREAEIMEAKRKLEADVDTTQLLTLVTGLCTKKDEQRTVDAGTSDAPDDMHVDPLK